MTRDTAVDAVRSYFNPAIQLRDWIASIYRRFAHASVALLESQYALKRLETQIELLLEHPKTSIEQLRTSDYERTTYDYFTSEASVVSVLAESIGQSHLANDDVNVIRHSIGSAFCYDWSEDVNFYGDKRGFASRQSWNIAADWSTFYYPTLLGLVGPKLWETQPAGSSGSVVYNVGGRIVGDVVERGYRYSRPAVAGQDQLEQNTIAVQNLNRDIKALAVRSEAQFNELAERLRQAEARRDELEGVIQRLAQDSVLQYSYEYVKHD